MVIKSMENYYLQKTDSGDYKKKNIMQSENIFMEISWNLIKPTLCKQVWLQFQLEVVKWCYFAKYYRELMGKTWRQVVSFQSR